MKTHLLFPVLMGMLVSGSHAQEFFPLDQGLNQAVFSLLADGDDLYVGGYFSMAGGNSGADYLARWDGVAWHSVGWEGNGTGINGPVWAIAKGADGIYVGGEFTLPYPHVMRWDGQQWHPLGDGLNGTVYALHVAGDTLYAGGAFTSMEDDIRGIAYWDGENWSGLGGGLNDAVYSVTGDGATIYAGGRFTDAGGIVSADFIASWNGTTWSSLGAGLDGIVSTLRTAEGQVFAGGLFTGYVASWDGEWHTYGSGPDLIFGEVLDIEVDDGRIYAAALEDGLASWDGNGWQWITPIHLSPDLSIFSICPYGQNLILGGEFRFGESGIRNIAGWGSPVTSAHEPSVPISQDLHVYPSPAVDFVRIAWGSRSLDGKRLDVSDSLGRMVFTARADGGQLNVSGLSPGCYALTCIDGHARASALFVKR